MSAVPGMQVNRPGEPGYAGVGITFSKVPLVLDPKDLAGVDVAIVGAPIDETVTYRPGARFGPRAIRLGDVGGLRVAPNMDLGIDPFQVLTVVDYGDAEVVPADQRASHDAIRRAVTEICAAGAIPIVLGGTKRAPQSPRGRPGVVDQRIRKRLELHRRQAKDERQQADRPTRAVPS